MREKFECFGATAVGHVRQTNEDQFLIADLVKSLRVQQSSVEQHGSALSRHAEGHILVVADGLGGHHAGEVASSIAVETLRRYLIHAMPWFFHLDEEGDVDFREELSRAFARCQERIRIASEIRPEQQGMGTTLTAAYIVWPRLYVAHVGDSRCYLFRRDKLKLLTEDHSVAQMMSDEAGVDAQKIPARWHHVLYNVLGGRKSDGEPDVSRADLHVGDCLVLCTDGLTRHVSDDEIGEFLNGSQSAQPTCERLIHAALERGGRDNVTVIVARFLEDDDATEISPAYAVVETADEKYLATCPQGTAAIAPASVESA